VIFEGNCRMQKKAEEEDTKVTILHNEKTTKNKT